MDTENLDFSIPPEFFGQKSFARHPKVINKCFFLKKSFLTMSLWTRGRQFRHNPMNNFCRKAKEILLKVQKSYFIGKNVFQQIFPRFKSIAILTTPPNKSRHQARRLPLKDREWWKNLDFPLFFLKIFLRTCSMQF